MGRDRDRDGDGGWDSPELAIKFCAACMGGGWVQGQAKGEDIKITYSLQPFPGDVVWVRSWSVG